MTWKNIRSLLGVGVGALIGWAIAHVLGAGGWSEVGAAVGVGAVLGLLARYPATCLEIWDHV